MRVGQFCSTTSVVFIGIDVHGVVAPVVNRQIRLPVATQVETPPHNALHEPLFEGAYPKLNNTSYNALSTSVCPVDRHPLLLIAPRNRQLVETLLLVCYIELG